MWFIMYNEKLATLVIVEFCKSGPQLLIHESRKLFERKDLI